MASHSPVGTEWARFTPKRKDASGTAADYSIRDAKLSDLRSVHDMIHGLACYENSADQMKLSYEDFERHSGLKLDPEASSRVAEKRFHCIVAENMNHQTSEGSTGGEAAESSPEAGGKVDSRSRIVAFALFFYNYSTWEGPSLYLEDVFVTDTHRGTGLGTKMMQTLAKIAVANECQRFQWQCLDWNKPSLDFYFDKLKAFERIEDDGAKWVNVMMKRARMEEMAAEVP